MLRAVINLGCLQQQAFLSRSWQRRISIQTKQDQQNIAVSVARSFAWRLGYKQSRQAALFLAGGQGKGMKEEIKQGGIQSGLACWLR